MLKLQDRQKVLGYHYTFPASKLVTPHNNRAVVLLFSSGVHESGSVEISLVRYLANHDVCYMGCKSTGTRCDVLISVYIAACLFFLLYHICFSLPSLPSLEINHCLYSHHAVSFNCCSFISAMFSSNCDITKRFGCKLQ